MKFAIINYNTTELTTCAILSIRKHHYNEIVLFDNSDINPFKNINLFNNITYIDNTKGQLIDFEKELNKYTDRTVQEQKCSGANFGSAKHTMSVQWLFDNLNEDIVLFDSDILLKKPIDFLDNTKICIAESKEDMKGIPVRIVPFMAYLNIPIINQYKIKFFDGNRMHALSKGKGYFYDTGASFYEDMMKKCPKLYKYINYNDYIIHFSAGSWKKFDKNLLIKYKNLYE